MEKAHQHVKVAVGSSEATRCAQWFIEVCLHNLSPEVSRLSSRSDVPADLTRRAPCMVSSAKAKILPHMLRLTGRSILKRVPLGISIEGLVAFFPTRPRRRESCPSKEK